MSKQRLDVKQAAEILGISSEGVRKRIKRGTLDHEKDSDGRVYVWLDTDWTTTNDSISSTRLVKILEEQIGVLRKDLADWKGVVAVRDEELRRKDHIIAAITERIPALDTPPRSPNDDVASKKDATETGTQSEYKEKRSWFKVLFGS